MQGRFLKWYIIVRAFILVEMEIINHDAAGIDVGSGSHYVAVSQSLDDVKEFGVYAEELTQLCELLLVIKKSTDTLKKH